MKKVITILCVIIMFAIGICTLAVKNKEAIFSEDENRMLEGMPSFTSETVFNGDFASKFEKFMIDRIPFRQQIISLQSNISQMFSTVTLEDTLNVIDTKTTQQAENMDEGEFEKTPEPTPVTITAEPTATVEPTAEIEETETVNPEVTISVAPIATPNPDQFAEFRYRYIKFIEPGLDKSSTLSKYSTKDIINYAEILNTLNNMLPSDGHTVYVHSLESAKMRPLLGSIGRGNEINIIDETVEVLEYFTPDNVEIISAPIILEEPMEREEDIYFFTDIHWTVEGVHYVYTETMERIGITPVKWEDYDISYEEPFLGTYYRDSKDSVYANNPDTLALINPTQASTFMHYLGDEVNELPILDFNAKSNDRFTVYFGGPKKVGPLGIVETTSETNRNALILIDSFGLPFANMLIPHYDTLCVMDLRYMYLSSEKYYIKDVVEENDIDDIFVVVSELNTFGTYYAKSMNVYMEEK